MNVVISIAVAVNPGDAFPSQSNLLVCLNPRGDLQGESSGTPRSLHSHHRNTSLNKLLKKNFHLVSDHMETKLGPQDRARSWRPKY